MVAIRKWIVIGVGVIVPMVIATHDEAVSSQCRPSAGTQHSFCLAERGLSTRTEMRMAQTPAMREQGCCALRDGTNGWDWSDRVTREQCIRDSRSVGGGLGDWYHYPREFCSAVKARCGPNPC